MDSSLSKKVISSVLSTVIFLNTNVMTIGMALTGAAFVSESAFAQEKDAVFNELQEKYATDNPYNNYNGENINIPESGPSEDLTGKLQNMLQGAQNDNEDLSLSDKIDPNFDQNEVLQRYQNNSLSIGATHSSPSQDASGNIKSEYAAEATVEVYRDPETGEMKIRAKDNAADIQRNSDGIGQTEAFSSELNHDQTSFEGKDTYGNESALFQVGRDTHSKLKSSSTRTGEANAYQAVTGKARQAINTEVPEQVLQPGFSAFEQNTQDGSAFLAGCTSSTSTEQGSLYRPEISTERCNEYQTDNLFYCEIEREIRVPAYMNGEGIRNCGPGCYEFDIGKEGDNYWSEQSCTVFSDQETITIDQRDGFRLSSVTIKGSMDDHTELTVNGDVVYTMIDGIQSLTGSLPGTSYANCDMKTNHQINYNVTSTVKNAVPAGTKAPYTFQLNTLVAGSGEHFVTVQMQFADDSGKGFGERIIQTPEGCWDAVAPEARPDYSGTDNYTAPPDDGSGGAYQSGGNNQTPSTCYYTGYDVLEEGTRGYPQSFLDDMGKLYESDTGNVTWRVNLEGYTCDPLKGQEFCVINPENEEECFTWDELRAQEQPNSCDAYVTDDQCSEVERECIDGWEHTVTEGGEETSYCFNEQVTFECDRGSDVTYEYTTETNSCDSMIPCAGGDCGVDNPESNDRFLEAAAMGNVAEHIKSDSSCTDPNDPSTCRVFEGEHEYCSWETSGLGTDCCEKPEGVNFATYLKASQALMDYDAKVLDGQYLNEPVSGAWKTVKEPITSGAGKVWDSLYEPFTSKAESIVGNLTGTVKDAAGTPIEHGFGEGLLGSVQQRVSQFIYDSLPEQLGEAIFTTGSSGAVDGLTSNVQAAANVLSTIMAIYATYQMIKLALTLISACDEEEQDVGLKLEMRQCFEVGDDYCHKDVLGVCLIKRQDHCCYGSMLSRIIMEQAAPMLGKDMSQCAGLTQQELQNLDFSQIDLSEWTATLIENDMLPENSEDGLTGSGRQDNRESRDLAGERTSEQMDGISDMVDDRTEALEDPDLDCSTSPRPPVCNYGFNPESDN